MATSLPPTAVPLEGQPSRPSRRRGPSRVERRVAWGVVGAGAVGGAFAGAEPTGLAPADVFFSAAFAAAVTLAASRSRRWTWLCISGVAAVAADGLALAAVGLAALGLAFATAVIDRRTRVFGALVGALAVQVLLRLPDLGFHGASALLTVVAVLPVFVSGYRRARSYERRRVRVTLWSAAGLGVILVVGFGMGVLQSARDLDDGVDFARAGLEAARDGDNARAAEQLALAARAFDGAHTAVTAPWARPARLLPVIGHHAAAIDTVAVSGADLARTAADAAGVADYDELRVTGGRIDLALVDRMTAPVRQSAQALVEADVEVDDVRSPWLLTPVANGLDDFEDEIAEARPDVELAADALEVAPALLGADGPRRYFVIFASPAESRELGGFMGNYGELTAIDGDVELTRSGRVGELVPDVEDPTTSTVNEPLSLTESAFPERYRRYIRGRNFQNITAAPDLPLVARATAELYPQAGGAPIDGVLYVDPFAIAALLQLTGPITIADLDEPLTADNAAELLLRGQYVRFPDKDERIDFLDEASEVTFERLTEGDLPGPRTAADALNPVVDQDRLSLHSFHQDEQAFFERYELDGRLPPVGEGDFFSVTNASTGGNKLDSFLEREIDYRARFDPETGAVSATATIRLINNAPSEGLPDYVIRNQFGLPFGTNTTYLSFFTPLALDEMTVDGQPVAVESQQELDRLAYATFLTIPSGATVTVSLELSGTLPPSSRYRLTMASQPLVTPDRVTVAVEPVGAWRARPGPAYQRAGNGATLTVEATTDTRFVVPLTGVGDQ